MKHHGNRRRGIALLAALLCLLSGCGSGASAEADAAPTGEAVSRVTAAPEAPPAAQAEGPAGTAVDALPEGLPETLTFCSGAGAWRTNLSLAPDGSFTGQYTDWDCASDFPGGIYHICTFSGTFSDLRQLDRDSCSLTLEELTCQETEGEEWVEDGTLYIGSAPYGLEGGTVFRLYAPEASAEVLTTESLRVDWPQWALPETVPEGTLGCWLLYNADMGQGFFSYP